MATIQPPPNSIWPNGLKTDSEGYVIFYPLGTNKVDISTITWPEGDKLISPFVYQNDKLVGFVDTKALIVSGSATTTMNYSHIEADFSSIFEDSLTVNAPNATVKKFRWAVSTGGDDNVIVTFKYKGCKTVDDIKAVDPDYLINDIVDGVWSERLDDLEQGGNGQYGGGMFERCTALTTFSSDLSSLTNGHQMFNCCTALTTFSSDLSNLTNGNGMFNGCPLTSFSAKLPKLEYGGGMFNGCMLDTASVQQIADTINTAPSSNVPLYIGIGNSTPNEQEKEAFNTMVSKGWRVFVTTNGSTPGLPWNPTSLTPENGEETTTPIPFWAKPVQTDEEHAQYVDSEGNFYNILGAQFIYGDDLSTYGMFTCEEDAATNMGLTPYIKPIEN